jgi:hypothetical protein
MENCLDIRSSSPAGKAPTHAASHVMQIPQTSPTKKLPEEINSYVLRRGNYKIYLADSSKLCSEAGALVRRMYSWRGYETENAAFTSRNPSQLTFVATCGQNVAGTVTLGFEKEGRLLADELFGGEINDYRKRGRKVCELSKFAIDPQYSSKEVIASLFQLAYIYGSVIHNATDLFGEVNPRHARSHERMFGFRRVNDETRTCPRVSAPAVLLHLEFEHVGAQIASLAGSRIAGERSIYPYCFRLQEMRNIN